MKLRNIGLMATLVVLFLPALAYAQVATGTTAASWDDAFQAVKALKTSWDQGVVVFIGSILTLLHVLLRIPQVQKWTKTGSDDILDFFVPLSGVLVIGYTAGAAAALIQPWYMAVVAGLMAAMTAAPFTSLVKEIKDKAGDEAKAAAEAESEAEASTPPPAPRA